MAYYNGTVTSYQELLDVLVNACETHGWTFYNQILSKEIAFFELLNSTNGISVQAGTGQADASLVNTSPVTVRLGRYGTQNVQQAFPMQYSLHIFENEVYLYTRFNVDYFYYVAFGYLNNTVWATACCGAAVPDHPGNGATIGVTGSYANHSRTQICGAFWNTNIPYKNSTISLNEEWLDNGTSEAISPLLNRQPNIWNGESIFIPVKIFRTVASNKAELITELSNSRYLRIDNYEPEQIVTLGYDKWKIYPFYRKYVSARDGGDQVSHSGTMGWAIRYDGP